jgi:hypothetical protein
MFSNMSNFYRENMYGVMEESIKVNGLIKNFMELAFTSGRMENFIKVNT